MSHETVPAQEGRSEPLAPTQPRGFACSHCGKRVEAVGYLGLLVAFEGTVTWRSINPRSDTRQVRPVVEHDVCATCGREVEETVSDAGMARAAAAIKRGKKIAEPPADAREAGR